jgi:multidrug resistance efflux pump
MTRLFSNLSLVVVTSYLILVVPSLSSADEPKQNTAAEAKHDSSDNVDVQLATARLKLAKVELERALAANERVPIYTDVTLELLRRNVDICEARLEALARPTEAKLHTAHARELESKLKITEREWQRAVTLHQRLPSSFDASYVEAARLRVDVARLALARARDPAHVTTQHDHMRWQLEQLRQEMLEMTLRVEELSNRQ